ncbi:hypothetical protein PGT21_029980 [Puccinia graminis f. sp. tritici]|uniref:Uncharacterized protein n=1 Tax=Puccinia graminis f. sp. tritici TaxID=56615 RepID=A0A5B0MG58_PUCGR|nr:hypothetical protein PGT21_029980 [Puccinia graminis f. sp. tritici]KAA1126650.1 hypothetical protein PGTUg99_031948 [Puccinia graminis f. sp. tritici]
MREDTRADQAIAFAAILVAILVEREFRVTCLEQSPSMARMISASNPTPTTVALSGRLMNSATGWFRTRAVKIRRRRWPS